MRAKDGSRSIVQSAIQTSPEATVSETIVAHAQPKSPRRRE